MIWAVQALSGSTITSAGTVTSPGFNTDMGRLCGFYYQIADATSGTYVSCTASILVAADSQHTYVIPSDSASAINNVLLIAVNSISKYIGYKFDDLPAAPWTQLRIKSSTDNTITIAGAYLVYTDN